MGVWGGTQNSGTDLSFKQEYKYCITEIKINKDTESEGV